MPTIIFPLGVRDEPDDGWPERFDAALVLPPEDGEATMGRSMFDRLPGQTLGKVRALASRWIRKPAHSSKLVISTSPGAG